MPSENGEPRAPSFRLLLITDRHALSGRISDVFRDLIEAVEAAVSVAPRGSVAVMLREKDLTGARLLDLADGLRAATRAAGAPFLVNDRVDVALAAGACGVHLPAVGLPPNAVRDLLGSQALIGVSTHSAEEVLQAEEGGASYVTFGPVFETPSKRRYGPPVGIESLREVTSRTKGRGFPVFGLGGITSPKEAERVMGAGAAGVAFIRAVVGAEDPAAALTTFKAPLGLE